MPTISNYTYDELSTGQRATFARQVSDRDIEGFAEICGDRNPVHLDDEFAARTAFGGRIAHGMLTGAFISAALAMTLPGPGTVYLSQSLRFRAPVKPGDEITVELEVIEKLDRRRRVTLDCKAYNQARKLVVSGTAEVMAPEEKMMIELPEPD
ncbi:MAG: MaoC family dehydratase [Pseudomonadota bacterium]